MNQAMQAMLNRYNCASVQDYENALKEIMQEIALLGLWRSKFFEHAAFYGETSLRILYGLDRFSEDLDFSLLRQKSDFTLKPYLDSVQTELNSMGFDVTFAEKEKSIASAVESAFIKAGTQEKLIKIAVPSTLSARIPKNRLMTIKFEVDTDPPSGFATEAKFLLQPIPFSVNTYSAPDLFAGTVHAILQRSWKNRVKGRDYYDFVWYIGRNIPVHIRHCEQRLRQSQGWTLKRSMEPSDLAEMLQAKFAEVNIDAARSDVLPFLRDPASVQLWSNEFFLSILSRLQFS